ncbi:carbon-nitrogen hydrolase family protein [Microbacterium sp. Y-01]|uniref:carbon-nitrogen hydrolase family protein n=1 Tax=Microbacterium sp. Y-01 TaxID=2048898 RepID=UPI0013DE6AD6|nr:carbon-nitrogen hydrolase family protein [Microbacterium sp. Y-01]
METIRVAMAQMRVDPGQPEANITRAVEMIGRAGEEGADAVVLPECLDLGWTSASARELALPLPGRAGSLADAAREAGVIVAAGLVERAGEALYNAAVLISENGEILQRYRKINEVPFAREVYETGDEIRSVPTRLGRVGMNICADNNYQSLYLGRSIAALGARVLFSPSAWAVSPEFLADDRRYGDEWILAYSAIARETGMPVIGVSNVGPVIGGEWDGWSCIGASLAVGPDGTVLAQLPFGPDAEHLTVVDVPLREPTATRG